VTKPVFNLAPPAPASVEAVTIPAVQIAPARQLTRQRVVLSLQVDEGRCLSCGGCVSVCPRMVVPVTKFNSLAEGILCQGCGLCVQVCPVEALSQVPVILTEPLRVPGHRDDRQAARLVPPLSDEPQ
jgi:Pyruvate/2-oxoacid:ferredoxin oxidoreductase delta subunit